MIIEVILALIEKNNKILIAQRKKGHAAGKWEFPGGKINTGETDEEAIEREIKEELDIIVKAEDFVAKNIHEYAEEKVEVRMYKCNYISGDIKLNVHADAKWINLADILCYDLVAGDIPLAKYLLEKN